MSRLMEEYTRKAAAYEAALSKIASTNRPVNSTASLWEIKETLYAGVGKGSQASSPSDLQTLHRALNGSRVISLGAKLTQQLATVAEEAENAGVIERLGPKKAREARLALGQALCLCLDGIADAGRGLTHAGPPDHAEFMARIRNPRTHPVNDLVTDLTLPDTMKALAAAARFVRCRLWPLAEEELAAAAAAEQGQGQGEAGAGEEQGEEEASQGAGGAAAGSSAADAPPVQTKVKIKRLHDSIRVMKLDPVDADSAAQLARQAGAAGGALLLSACAALHGAVGVIRHECDVVNTATPFAQALLGSLISTQALDEIAAEPPSAAPYTSVYCMAFMTLTDVLTDVCGLAGPCGPGPIQLLTQPALLRLRYEMLEQVAATAPGGADEGIEGIGKAGGGRGTGAAVGLAAAGGAARVRLWPVMQRDTLRAVFGPRVQLTRSMFTFVVNAAGAPIAAQQHSEAACDRAAVMAFPDRRRAVALAAAASRALAARLEHLGAAGAAEPSAEARVTPRMLYDAAQHFPPVVHALVGAAPPREAAALVGDALLMYGWLLRCLVTPAGLAGAGRGGLETDSEKLMPFCTTYTIQDSPLNDDPLFKAWRRMTPLQRAAAAARALAARIPQSMDGVARQLAAQGEVPLEAVAGSADLVTMLLRAQLQRWRARLAAALAAREEAEATEAAAGAEEGVAGAGAAALPPLPAPPSISELGLLLTAVKVMRCEAERLAAENAAAAAASSSGNSSSSSGSSSSSRAALLPALLQGEEPVHWVLAEHLMRWVGHREGGLASLLPELQPAAAAAAAATAGGSSSSASKAGKGKSKAGCSTATGGGGAAAAERLALGEAQRVVLEAMALAGVAVMQLYGEMLAAAVRHWDEQDGQQAQPGSAAPPRRAAAAGAAAAAASKQELCKRLTVIAIELMVLVALLPPPVLLAAPMPPQRLMPLLARALLHVQNQLGLGGGGGDSKGGKKKKGGEGGGAAAPQEWTAAMDGWRELVLRLSAEPRLCAACVPGWLWGAPRADGGGGKVGGGKAGGGKAGGGRREVDSLQVDLTVLAAAGMEVAAAGAGASTSAGASASTPPAAAAGAAAGTSSGRGDSSASGGGGGGGGAPGVAVPGPVLLVRGAVVASTLGSLRAEWSPQAWLQHQQQVVSLAQATLRAEHHDGGGDEAAYEGWRQAAAALPGGGEEGILGPAAARLCGNPRCSNFGGASEAALELKKCTACRAVRYCGAGCQKEHWRAGHKEACRRPPP